MVEDSESDCESIDLTLWAFQAKPQIQQRDGEWTAHYPDRDWSVSAATEHEARQRLREELLRRQNAGDVSFGNQDTVRRRHLREPIPGMYAMSNALYLQLRERDASQEDFERAFTEAEEKRRAGESYTLEDYLRPR